MRKHPRTPTPPSSGKKKSKRGKSKLPTPSKRKALVFVEGVDSTSTPPTTSSSGQNDQPERKGVMALRVLPLNEREKKEEKERRRGMVYLSVSTMQRLGVVLGDPVLCARLSADSTKLPEHATEIQSNDRAVGIVWMGAGLKDDEVRMDPLTTQNSGTKFGDFVLLSRLYAGTPYVYEIKQMQSERDNEMDKALSIALKGWVPPNVTISDAVEVVVQFLSEPSPSALARKATGAKSELAETLKTWLTQFLVGRHIICGNVYTISYYGQERVFRIEHIKSGTSNSDEPDRILIGKVTNRTIFTNSKEKPNTKAVLQADGVSKVTYDSVGGLKEEIAKVREVVELALQSPETFTNFGLKPPKGVLLYGPPGTGKTMIARAVAHESNAHVYIINGPEIISKFYGESEAKLRGIFREAAANAPSLVFIDEIDAIAPKRDDKASDMENRVVATLLTLMDGMEAHQGVIVIAATNRPNSLDPALRRAGRFDNEIEIGIPTERGRNEILNVILKDMPHSLTPEEIQNIASKTHGFVGADLASLCREAALVALNRCSSDLLSDRNLKDENWDDTSLDSLIITNDDVLRAMRDVHPSAMREVLVDVPKVLWSDIGGQEDIKQKLKEAVEWPLQHPEAFQRMGIRPPRGILLYGPPGCSKTLMAKALATESGTNFIAVKGPELFSKWVGESEKAVKEVFRKARAAAPSIIFFDEIDAMAVHRGGGDEGTSGVTDRVLSQLLTEMSGIETLKNVTIVAATNRPDMIDKALLRPGRIDRMLYVAPPDGPSRESIFRIQLRRIPHPPELEEGLQELVETTEGYSGAELAGVCKEACLFALREDLETREVCMRHFQQAIKAIPPRITPDVLEFYAKFQKSSGLESL